MVGHTQDSLDLLPVQIKNILRQIGIEKLTEPQEKAIPSVMSGKNILLVAPTGSGKTEAVLLPLLSKLVNIKNRKGISLIYITPLRALNRDMLRRFLKVCTMLNLTVDVRHGDTPPSLRRKQALKPPDILITTPETLQSILPGKRMQENLRSVKYVVVDEFHEIAESKRGTQLSIALERLREVTSHEFQRIGLSATIGNPEKVAKMLVGAKRSIEIIYVPIPKGFSYEVIWPRPSKKTLELSSTLFTSVEAAARIETIKKLSETHTSTLIFVNSRQVAELLALKLSYLSSSIGIHHSSLSREEREKIEEDFKKGNLKAIVCTSTLELGIDIGSVDLVVQYLSPRQVKPFIQRVGRSGHKLGLTSRGVIVTAFTDDALEAIAVLRRAKFGLIEPTKIHENALDVLAHQIVGLTMDHRRIKISHAFQVISRSYCFSKLDKRKFFEVLDFLSRLGLVKIRSDELLLTEKSRSYYFSNLSMIPDEKRYPIVDLTTNRTIGVVGEEFVTLRAKEGLHFICRGLVWNIEEISEDGYVYVTPVDDPTAALPGWDGEILPVPYELAKEVGKLRREISKILEEKGQEQAIAWLCNEFQVDLYTAYNIVKELQEQINLGAPIPSDEQILIEGFDKYLVVNCCFGESVNRTLGYIIEQRLSRDGLVKNWWVDGYRILVELPFELTPSNFDSVVNKLLPINSRDAEKDFKLRIKERFPFGYYMKFIAERFGMIERGLTLSESKLLSLYSVCKNTPIYDETMREVLQEKLDLRTTKQIISEISKGKIKLIKYISKESPTPLSYHILNKYVELPEVMAPEGIKEDSIERLKNSILSSKVELICMECGSRQGQVMVANIPQKPRCFKCGSTLLGIIPKNKGYIEEIIRKRLNGESLEEDELKMLSDIRKTADIINSYGKNGVIALSVYGIGPQTAFRILSKMHYSDYDLIKELLEAKIKYIQTKPYWS
ncbi:MAG: DEAD/DEAH box helicase [Thermoproteota archaeon]